MTISDFKVNVLQCFTRRTERYLCCTIGAESLNSSQSTWCFPPHPNKRLYIPHAWFWFRDHWSWSLIVILNRDHWSVILDPDPWLWFSILIRDRDHKEDWETSVLLHFLDGPFLCSSFFNQQWSMQQKTRNPTWNEEIHNMRNIETS